MKTEVVLKLFPMVGTEIAVCLMKTEVVLKCNSTDILHNSIWV